MNIRDIEPNLSHASFYFRGSYIYPLIKQELLRSHMQEHEKQFYVEKYTFREKLNKLIAVFRNSILLLTQSRLTQYDALFVDSSSSRRYVKDQKAYSLYCDFIIERLSASKAVLLELPSRHAIRPVGIATSNIFYPDLAFIWIYIKTFFVRIRIREAEQIINELGRFSIKLKYREVNRLLKRFTAYSRWFDKVLQKVDPDHVFLVCSYSYLQMALIRASKKRNIPVIELQHGHITRQHYGYIYSHLENRDLIPDYFFAYGRYFSDLLKLNSLIFEPGRIFDTGYLYLEEMSVKNPDIVNDLLRKAGNRRIVLISSQITTRDVLIEITKNLIESGSEELFILYKPHPGELDASEYYRELIGKHNCILILQNQFTTLELLRIADIHVTVYSSVFMEAYYFKVPTVFYYKESFSENILEFVDDNFYFLCRDFKELLRVVQNNCGKTPIKAIADFEFYKSDPWGSFRSAMKSISGDNTVS